MKKILASVACNLDTGILAACYPLFEEERVQAIEWSFDALYDIPGMPSWFAGLLQAFSDEKRLIGHGVFFSLFSGRWSSSQAEWLKHLKKICAQYNFDHITEHFGFMTGKDFHQGAPLNIPYTTSTLRLGIERLKYIADACKCPVGLENLAFSYSLEEVKKHGEFLSKLVEPVNGFIILDLHNLYCQLRNFNIHFDDIINLYPLEKVREIHISGGSWDESEIDKGRKIRRDTHDDKVPAEVFELLELTIPLCPNLKYLVMEQLGNGLTSEESRQCFYDDFLKMEAIVEKENNKAGLMQVNTFLPPQHLIYDTIAEDETLHMQQTELSQILETAASYHEAIDALKRSSLAASSWNIEQWQPYMLETAIKIAQKWKKGFQG